MFEVTRLAIPDVMVLAPAVKSDHRGDFSEVYNERDLAAVGIGDRFVVDNHVRNVKANVLRGLHYQDSPQAQSKLVRVTRGRIYDVAVDIRHGSATFGRHVGVTLDANELKLLYVPEGFAHGFCVLEDGTDVHYKVNRYPVAAAAKGILWNDPALRIHWPLTGEAILAERDTSHPTLAEFSAGMPGPATTAVSGRTVEQIIDALESERCRALIAKDVAALESICSRHLVYTHTSTRRDSRESFIQRVRTGFYDYREFTRGESRITVVGSTAFVTGRLQSRVVVEGTEKRLDNAILAVWAKEEDGWKFVAYQPTPIPAFVPA